MRPIALLLGAACLAGWAEEETGPPIPPAAEPHREAGGWGGPDLTVMTQHVRRDTGHRRAPHGL